MRLHPPGVVPRARRAPRGESFGRVRPRDPRLRRAPRRRRRPRALLLHLPPDRTQFSVRAHRAVRINAEWDAIHAKIAGDDVAYRDCRVACIVAALELPPDGTLPPGFDVESLDGACVVPAGADGSPPLVVLGTLDVNQGTKLPAEELTGVYPTLADPVPPGTRLDEDGKGTNAEGYGEDEKLAPGTRPARYRRAYLSNVCVLPPARRTGVGRRLMEEALEVARGWGVERMYVHVVEDNLGAKSFYEDFGFVKEAAESKESPRRSPGRRDCSSPCPWDERRTKRMF